MTAPDYDARVKAIGDAARLMRAMDSTPSPAYAQVQTVRPGSLDRYDVTELARFLLGLDDDFATSS